MYRRLNDLNALSDAAYEDLCELFDTQVKKGAPTECWPWQNGTHTDGRGQICVNNQTVPAPRVAYLLYKGDIPDAPSHHGIVVMHTCDNPPCCNPAHLTLGSQGDNMRDRTAKGRAGRKPTVVPLELLESIRSASGTLQQVSNTFGVSMNLVWKIRNGKR